jgi:hypothetical protein
LTKSPSRKRLAHILKLRDQLEAAIHRALTFEMKRFHWLCKRLDKLAGKAPGKSHCPTLPALELTGALAEHVQPFEVGAELQKPISKRSHSGRIRKRSRLRGSR